MKILVDVYNAAGERQGDGPITSAQGVIATRVLDGVGSLSLVIPAGDERALELLVNERRIKVWGFEEGAARRLIADGIVRTFEFSDSDTGQRLAISGPDSLDELKRVQTWLAWQQDDQTPATIAAALVALASGWTANTGDLAALENLSVRFDGASALKALQAVVQQKGVHFRLEADHAIKFGAFGEANGLKINQVSSAPSELLTNDDVLLIDTLQLTYDSESVVNRIVVLGPGDVEAALSLKYATRTTPYTVQSMVKNGLTLYYIEDTESIEQYGAIEKVFQASNIAALSNSTADIENAANALYDLAAAWLERNAVRQEVYKVALKKARENIKPGDTVWLDYRGWAVNEAGERVKWVTLRDDYWIISVAERIGLEASTVDLELSNVDQAIANEADIVLGAISDLQVRNVTVKPYLSKDTLNPPAEAIDSSHDVEFPLTFGDYTARLNQVIFRLRTRPFRTLASGGDHNHRMFAITSPTGFPATSDQPFLARDGDGGATLYCKFESNSSSKDVWTQSGSGDLDFGIGDDTSTPVSISIYVDDVLVESGLAPSGGNLDYDVDITSYFSETGFQGSHTIKVTCASGQGLVIGEIEVRETIQAIATV